MADLLSLIDARFVSGNEIPVERAHIKASEWRELRRLLSASPALPHSGVVVTDEMVERFIDAAGIAGWDHVEDRVHDGLRAALLAAVGKGE